MHIRSNGDQHGEGAMRPLRRVGSAAGIFTVGSAQAADLLTKAQAVEYVKARGLYSRAPRPCITSKKTN
jgi:hypothetical protein